MQHLITILFLAISTLSFGQTIETGRLWRTKGVYYPSGKFLEWDKVQYYLYSTKPNQFHSLRIEHLWEQEGNIRYDGGVVTYRDTLDLTPLEGKIYKLDKKRTMTIHSEDSLTINYKDEYVYSYVKFKDSVPSLTTEKLKNELIEKQFVESIEDTAKYRMIYQDRGFVKKTTLKGEHKSNYSYKIIDFNGFIFLQEWGKYIAKLITEIKKEEIVFIEIDYRFENKKGKLLKIN